MGISLQCFFKKIHPTVIKKLKGDFPISVWALDGRKNDSLLRIVLALNPCQVG